MRLLLLLLSLCAATALAQPDWRLVRDDSDRDIRIFVRDQVGNSYHAFYAVTHVRARLSTVVAVLADVSAAPEWVARVTQAKVMRRRGDREAWIYTVYKLPYPFLQRDTVLHTLLTQDAETGAVMVDTEAVPDVPPPDFVSAGARHVRLIKMHSIWKLTPEAGGVVTVELWGEGDPGGFIPSWLFNYNLPDEPALTFRNLRRMILRPKYQSQNLAYIREPKAVVH